MPLMERPPKGNIEGGARGTRAMGTVKIGGRVEIELSARASC